MEKRKEGREGEKERDREGGRGRRGERERERSNLFQTIGGKYWKL